MNPDDVVIVFDMKLMKPGCVNLQAAMGGGVVDRNFFMRHFDSQKWLVHITPDMKRMRATREQWHYIIKKYNL